MSLIKATWALYRDTARDTAKALPRSGPALLFLLLATCFELVLGSLLGGLGFAGGIVMGFIDAFLCGWYLALLRILVMQNRKLFISDIREVMGDYFNEVIMISFTFGIIRLVIHFSAPELNLLYVPLVALLFNPAPEMVYQEREEVFALLQRALKFMGENWPEWLVGHVLLFGFLGFGSSLLLDSWQTAVVFLSGLYGPWFGFLGVGPAGLLFLVTGGLLGLVIGAFLFVGSHLVMVFRGALYKRLSRTNRRGRAWQAQVK